MNEEKLEEPVPEIEPRILARYLALREEDFRDPKFTLETAAHRHEQMEQATINPMLLKAIQEGYVDRLLDQIKGADKHPVVTNPIDTEGLVRTITDRLGHGANVDVTLKMIVGTDIKILRSYQMSRIKDETTKEQNPMTFLEQIIEIGGDITNKLSYGSYTGQFLGSELPKASEEDRITILAKRIAVSQQTLTKAIEYAQYIKSLSLNLLERMVRDPSFDIRDESSLTPQQQKEFNKIIDEANYCFEYLSTNRDKYLRTRKLPSEEDIAEENRRIVPILENLLKIIQIIIANSGLTENLKTE